MKTHLILLATLPFLSTDSWAQDMEHTNIWRARPQFQLSMGTEPGPLLITNQPKGEPGDELASGWRLGAMFRPKGGWVAAGSYSFHAGRGHLQFVDSVVHVPGHWVILPPFISWWEGPYDRTYLDLVTIDQNVHSYESCWGYTLPGKWPRKRVFINWTALTGARCMAVKELHTYTFSTATPDQAIQVQASSIGWTWMLRLRTDLHVTKFASIYAEVISSQPVGKLRLNTSATWNGETRSVNGKGRPNTDLFMGFGVAVHL